MAKREKVNLTDASVRHLKIESKLYRIWDEKLPGFGVEVRPNGRRIFLIKYRDPHGRQRWKQLGIWEQEVRAESARKTAGAALFKAKHGEDPFPPRPDSMTVADALEHLLEVVLPARGKRSPRTISNYRTLAGHIGADLGSMPVEALRRSDVERLLRRWADRPATARQLLRLLSQAIDAAYAELDLERRSPCQGIPTPTVKARGREGDRAAQILTDDHVKEIAKALRSLGTEEALDALPSDLARHDRRVSLAAIWVILDSGWRKREVFSLDAGRIDFRTGRTFIARTKKGAQYRHLSRFALEAIAALHGVTLPLQTAGPAEVSEFPKISGYAFPSGRKSKSGHIEGVRKTWDRVREIAGVTDLGDRLGAARIHDFRHRAGGDLLAQSDREIAGDVLGHVSGLHRAYEHRSNLLRSQTVNERSERLHALLEQDEAAG